jgi:hypothetical protein
MNIFRKLVAGIGAVLVTATLMALPDMVMAEVPGAAAAGFHSCIVLARV